MLYTTDDVATAPALDDVHRPRPFMLRRLIEITARIQMSMPLQREDFRKRLEAARA